MLGANYKNNSLYLRKEIAENSAVNAFSLYSPATMNDELDTIDRKILNHLQQDGRASNIGLAEAVSLSPTAVHARTQRLFREGYVKSVEAQLDARKLGVGTTLFVEVRLDRTTPNVLDAFSDAVQVHAEIAECHMIAGGFDFLLKMRVRDMEHFHNFANTRLWMFPGVRETRTYTVMKEIKSSTRIAV
jgi:Lrp/AsnC family transcriptional regulator, leucine-responsive regulatory protein